MFITDKHGRLVFFPWRNSGNGYIVPDLKLERRIRVVFSGFHWISAILIILLFISPPFLLSQRGGNLLCIGTFIGVPINLVVLYFLAIEAITNDLPVYHLSCKELILDNLSSDDDEIPDD